MFNIREVQERLASLGYDPGPIDCVRGRRTIGAVEQFQRNNGLEVDGIVGPITEQALFKIAAPQTLTVARSVDAMPWLVEARRLIGTREIAGKRNNSVIMNWAERLGVWYPNDETAWCGLFVAHCIGSQLPDEAMPTNPLGARNWATFGHKCGIVTGAIAVFWRGKRSGWQGHVGFVTGYDAKRKRLRILGGNQGNTVREDWLSEDRLLATRWPLTALPPSGGVDTASSAGAAVSTNEA